MAKHPTPKRRIARSATKTRYASFQYKARKRLSNRVHLVDCSNCKQKRLTHTMCPHCGYYRGRKVMEVMKIKKPIQTIKA